MVRELPARTDAPAWSLDQSPDAYLAEVDAYLQAHARTVRFLVGDGYAIYQVIDQPDGEVALQHLPVLDAWEIPAAHVRGLTSDEVRQMLERDRRLAELFS